MNRALLLGVMWAAAACGESRDGGAAMVTRLSPEGAQDYAASVSPDGSQVAFWRRGGLSYELWIADADLANGRSLGVPSFLGTQIPAVWSSDGTRLLVSTSAASISDVAVVDVATGAVTTLTDSPALQIPIAFHPDGDRVVFAAYAEGGTVRAYLASVASGEVAAMVPGLDDPQVGLVSPDGAHLLYNTFAGGSGILWTSAVDGGERRQLTTEGYESLDLFSASPWSPDGRSFLYLSTRTGKPDLWVASVDGGTRQLTTDISADESPAWSPSGRWVAFVSQRGRQTDLWVIPAEGGEARRVTDDVLEEGLPTWLDDSTLVFSTGNQRGSYWRRAVADTAETRILPDSIDAGGFMESPDRRWLAFFIRHPGGNDDLAVIHPDGTGLRVLSRDADHDDLVWDPTSSRLAWTTDQGGNRDAYFADLTGEGPPVKVDGWPGFERPAYWTADGSGLVIVADRESRLGDLWRIPLGAGDTTRLTRLGSVVDAGTVVAEGRDQVFVVGPDSATGELMVAALLPDDRLRPLVGGLGVVRPINRLLASPILVGQTGTVIYRYDGTILHRLEGVGGPSAFSRDDSKLLIATQGGQADIAMVHVATGEIVRLTNTPEDETNMAFTAGGDSIVFRRVRFTSELMRADISRILQ